MAVRPNRIGACIAGGVLALGMMLSVACGGAGRDTKACSDSAATLKKEWADLEQALTPDASEKERRSRHNATMKVDAEDMEGPAQRRELASKVLAAEKTFDEARTALLEAAAQAKQGADGQVVDRSGKALDAFDKWKKSADQVTEAVNATVLFANPKADVKGGKVIFFPDIPAIEKKIGGVRDDTAKARAACGP